MEEMIRDHWSSRAMSYSQLTRDRHDSDSYRALWEDFYAELLQGCGKKTLDCGCGPGAASLRVSDLGFDVTGMDFSSDMLETARSNAAKYSRNIEFVQGDAEDIPFPDNSFDTVVSQYMLWTVPHPDKVISEWYRVLRPGGRLVYIDGTWFDNPRNTRWNRFRMRMCRGLNYVGKSNSGRSSSNEFSRNLWSVNADRPRDDLLMLEKQGFVNISPKRDIARRIMGRKEYYCTALCCEYFAISAEKPDE